jgi:hypothetical protein
LKAGKGIPSDALRDERCNWERIERSIWLAHRFLQISFSFAATGKELKGGRCGI